MRAQDIPNILASSSRAHHCPKGGPNVCKCIKQTVSDCNVFMAAAAVAVAVV